MTDATTSPGSSSGILTVDGAYTQDSASDLVIDLGGSDPGDQYDRLAVTGTANLDGILRVRLENGFAPDLGDTFEILTSSALNGYFHTEDLSPVEGGELLLHAYDEGTSVFVTATQLLTYNIWAAREFDAGELANANISGPDADPDGDGVPNLLEYFFPHFTGCIIFRAR